VYSTDIGEHDSARRSGCELGSMADLICQQEVASTLEKYQTLFRDRVSKKRWHIAQVLERELVNTSR
jgi:hypothetical protein